MNICRNSGKGFFWGSFVVLLIFTIALSTGCASYHFRRELNQLRVGMTKDEVQAILGPPTGWERKQIASDDLREVWIYHVLELNTSTPLYPTLYILTFSNGKLKGLNLPNPYDPSLKTV